MPPALLKPPTAMPSADALLSVVVLGLFCTAAAFVLFGALIAEVGAGRATVITYVSPIVAVALGVAVLGERPGAGAVAGLLLVLAGSWLSTDGRLPPGLGNPIDRLHGRFRPDLVDRQPDVADDLSPSSSSASWTPAASEPGRMTRHPASGSGIIGADGGAAAT
jgi:hypothetical protein